HPGRHAGQSGPGRAAQERRGDGRPGVRSRRHARDPRTAHRRGRGEPATVTASDDRAVVERFWAAVHANDFRAAGELLHDDYLLEWPQSGERIPGRGNLITVNERYPAER